MTNKLKAAPQQQTPEAEKLAIPVATFYDAIAEINANKQRVVDAKQKLTLLANETEVAPSEQVKNLRTIKNEIEESEFLIGAHERQLPALVEPIKSLLHEALSEQRAIESAARSWRNAAAEKLAKNPKLLEGIELLKLLLELAPQRQETINRLGINNLQTEGFPELLHSAGYDLDVPRAHDSIGRANAICVAAQHQDRKYKTSDTGPSLQWYETL